MDQTLKARESTADVSASSELKLVKEETAKHVQEAEQRSATEDEAEVPPTSRRERTPRTPKTDAEVTIATVHSTPNELGVTTESETMETPSKKSILLLFMQKKFI